MKTILIGLISVVSFLTGSTASADLLGDDDSYLGLQVSIPLGASRGKVLATRYEYHAMLINQRDGIRDGIVFTRDTGGERSLGYLGPSRTFRIDEGRISDYTIPLVNLRDGEIRSPFDVMGAAVGLAVVVVVIGKAADKVLSETVDCIDPDVSSEEIAGC